MSEAAGRPASFGTNDWLVEEMYQQYLESPSSVSESWQEFFADYRTGNGKAGNAQRTGSGDLRPDGDGTSERGKTEVESEAQAESKATAKAKAEPKQEGQPRRKPDGVTAAEARGTDAAAPSDEDQKPAAKKSEAKAGGTDGDRRPAAKQKAKEPGGNQADAEEPGGKRADAKKPGGKQADAEKPGGKQTEGDSAAEPEREALRGASARIAANMEASLAVPTATSFRQVPAKLLEVNRRVINGYLGRTGGGKVSFTHLIGYAVVRAFDAVPNMRSTYEEIDGKPHVVRHDTVGLGLAVDIEKPDGSRTLLVPCIRDADTLDFSAFHAAYEELIRKVRSNKLSPDDFAGTTATLTNPGTIGTVQSVPRLMPGQSVIVGVGALDHSAEFQGADPRALAELGVSKILTISSTYDHRVIQGAESGVFLQRIHELLLGADEFYDEIFRSLELPYEPVRWRADINPVDSVDSVLHKQMQVNSLINMYRVRGHLIADLDPLSVKEPHMHPELDPATYGLTIWDLDREFLTGGLAGQERLPLGEILHILRDAYCRSVGVEYMHIQEPDQKRWIQEQVEGRDGQIDPSDQHHILERLNAAEAFERFLATKYLGAKRFGIEGAESAIPLLDAILEAAADARLAGAVLGMAHRGRLNVLANIVGKSLPQIFREFEGAIDPDMVQGSGDVKYHLGAKGSFNSRRGYEMPIELAANPSHLEAVDPVVEGMVRAMQDLIDQPTSFSVLPLLIHGDAAFAGQGVVAETLNMSDLKGYRTGGTVHLVINNQLGFTTAPEFGRSSVYATDIAKVVQAPIFHVNGDDPEACVRVARLAFEFRQTFKKDVVIDMWCYRRHGHNEGDDPSYTQPLMYRRIEEHRSARKRYVETLVRRGDLTLEEAEQALDDFSARLQAALDETRSLAPAKGARARPAPQPLGVLPQVETGVERERLDEVFEALAIRRPEGFTVHPKLAKQFEAREKLWASGEVDWPLAEALSFGSILQEGTDIRFAGQDSRRGTFSQRHAVLVDYETGEEHAPLAHISPDQGKLWIYDSLLSEYAAMGFEYGYSVVHKDALVCWEAQFGDFANGAQVIIDQFIAAAEDKWEQTSGLVLLLPHGYDGQGPEHSSGRIERFLVLAAEDNIQVVNATSAAQYFHLLRRQVRRDVRKPLVGFTPKYLLRAREARSPIEALTEGRFEEVLDDASVEDPTTVERIVLCSGKVAYELIARRDELGAPAAVVRIEQIYPWPAERIAEIIERYESASSLYWVQEEPENMGAWSFVHGRLHQLLPERLKLGHASRSESGSPATGSATIHAQEQDDLLQAAFAGLR